MASATATLHARLPRVGWNASASDWEQRDAAWITAEVQRQLKPGGIVLMHDQLFAYSDARRARDDMLRG